MGSKRKEKRKRRERAERKRQPGKKEKRKKKKKREKEEKRKSEVPKDQVADMLWVGVSTVSFNSFAEMIYKRNPHMLTVTPFDALPPVGD